MFMQTMSFMQTKNWFFMQAIAMDMFNQGFCVVEW
jgi:hypothetical protein